MTAAGPTIRLQPKFLSPKNPVPRLGTELSPDSSENAGVLQGAGSDPAQQSITGVTPDVGDLARRLATLPPDTLAALSALLGGLPPR